jgi:hypothetical protein
MSTTKAIPGSNARYTERLTPALAPAWSTGRRIASRGSETYRFVTPLRQRLDLLQANYGILVDGSRGAATRAPRHTSRSRR